MSTISRMGCALTVELLRGGSSSQRMMMTMHDLKPCPFCSGEIEERGGQCNYGKKIMTLDLKCKKCGTIFKFKSRWEVNPYSEAVDTWNRSAGNDEKYETD